MCAKCARAVLACGLEDLWFGLNKRSKKELWLLSERLVEPFFGSTFSIFFFAHLQGEFDNVLEERRVMESSKVLDEYFFHLERILCFKVHSTVADGKILIQVAEVLHFGMLLQE